MMNWAKPTNPLKKITTKKKNACYDVLSRARGIASQVQDH
jgi:hypothetical protein